MNATLTDLRNATRALADASTPRDKRTALDHGIRVARSYRNVNEDAICNHGTAAQRAYTAWKLLETKTRKELS